MRERRDWRDELYKLLSSIGHGGHFIVQDEELIAFVEQIEKEARIEALEDVRLQIKVNRLSNGLYGYGVVDAIIDNLVSKLLKEK